MDLSNKLHRFGLATGFLNMMYFSGQCGFNTGLIAMVDFSDDTTYILLNFWLTTEGIIMVLTSTLLLFGIWASRRAHVLKWCIVAVLCIVIYAIFSILEITSLSSKLEILPKLGTAYYARRCDVIGIIWRIYIIASIYFIVKLYKSMKDE